MRKLSWALVAATFIAVPLTARAGGIVSVSLGTGAVVSPGCCGTRTPTNIMVAPGYGLGEMIRAELGVVGVLDDVEGGEYNLSIRPMLVLDPPIIPIYVRAIFAVNNLLEGDTSYTYGGAIGVGLSLLGLGIFAEAGILPNTDDITVFEVRAGAYYAF